MCENEICCIPWTHLLDEYIQIQWGQTILYVCSGIILRLFGAPALLWEARVTVKPS